MGAFSGGKALCRREAGAAEHQHAQSFSGRQQACSGLLTLLLRENCRPVPAPPEIAAPPEERAPYLTGGRLRCTKCITKGASRVHYAAGEE